MYTHCCILPLVPDTYIHLHSLQVVSLWKAGIHKIKPTKAFYILVIKRLKMSLTCQLFQYFQHNYTIYQKYTQISVFCRFVVFFYIFMWTATMDFKNPNISNGVQALSERNYLQHCVLICSSLHALVFIKASLCNTRVRDLK